MGYFGLALTLQRNTHFLPPDKVKLSLNFMLKSNGHDVMV